MKRILIIGPKFYNYNTSLSAAFNSLGLNSIVLEHNEPYTPYTLTNRILNKILGKRFRTENIKEFNRNIKRIYNQFDPDITIIIKGDLVSKETIVHLKKSRIFLWMMDSIKFYEDILERANLYDHIFCFEYSDISFLAKLGINGSFLPLAVDDTLFYPINCSKEIDILFIGNLNEKRIQIINSILVTYPNLNIKIYGKHYNFFQNPIKYIFRKNKNIYLNKNVTPNTANTLYNKSRICLNIHHEQSIDSVNPRFFEIMLTTGFQLVDEKPFILNNFEKLGFETFSSELDLLQKINSIINGKKSEGLSFINYELIKRQHTFINRAQTILDHE